MDQQEIVDLEELFATKGWQRVVRDAQTAADQRIAAIANAKSWDDVRFAQGELAQLAILINLESSLELYKSRLADEDEAG